MRLLESRRITGPHLLLDRPGAAAEIQVDPGEDTGSLVEEVRQVVGRLGWPWRHGLRRWTGGVSLAFEAPEDVLEAAAWVFDHVIERSLTFDALQQLVEAQRNPALLALLAAARAQDLPVFWDEDGVTVGLGARGRTWPLDQLPDPRGADVLGAGRIPFCFVTGTNGKTTTTRLVARMAREAGLVSGHTSSDGVCVGADPILQGDWTGPGAARRLLRDARVEIAVLETARGGLMRRGLVVSGADAALVTNVSDDHLGEWGIEDLRGTAEAKLVVAKGLRPGGALIINGACVPLVEAAAGMGAVCFGVDPQPDTSASVDDGWLVLHGRRLLPVDQVPITLRGAARFNVENALGAALLASALGLSRAAIEAGLRAFSPSPEDNAGRLNVFQVRGASIIVDFAHNPDGMRQLGRAVRAMGATRRVLVFGQAGDRREEDVGSLVDEVMRIGFDRIVLKELPRHRRGRLPGEVPAMLRRMLLARGYDPAAVDEVPGEVEAAARVLALARPGDVVLLLVHEEFEAVLALLRQAQRVA